MIFWRIGFWGTGPGRTVEVVKFAVRAGVEMLAVALSISIWRVGYRREQIPVPSARLRLFAIRHAGYFLDTAANAASSAEASRWRSLIWEISFISIWKMRSNSIGKSAERVVAAALAVRVGAHDFSLVIRTTTAAAAAIIIIIIIITVPAIATPMLAVDIPRVVAMAAADFCAQSRFRFTTSLRFLGAS